MFWRRTPRQIMATFAAHEQRRMREHNDRAWLAWHIAALQRAKKMPKLERLMLKPSATKRRRRQSVEEQMAIMERWASHMQRAEDKKARLP